MSSRQSSTVAEAEALSRKVIWAYALPAMPLAVLTIPFYVILPAYYIEVFGVSASVMGFALIALRLFDGITDPIAGFLSDKTRTRFGRRKPWIVAGTPMVGVAEVTLLLAAARNRTTRPTRTVSAALEPAWTPRASTKFLVDPQAGSHDPACDAIRLRTADRPRGRHRRAP